MRAGNEYRQNAGVKRDLIVERDPAKMKVKVRFDDEDETDSMWVDVLAASAGSVKSFMMPNENDEVWCMLDAKGEDGCIVGSKYNDQDAPPSDDNAHITLTGAFGTLHIDGSNLLADITGNVTIRAGGNVNIEAGGSITTTSAELTHNGKNVGHDHKHVDVEPGPSLTGVPA
ncbi:phage baseplate assembly protein V [Hoeflea sp.]|uniref:phage baseplate assembly protein V n=1 Tax=Hoeflea sp. TaxID=1940281 RepID=UPI0025C0675B|nr:phage baseplate assembly protein V [Hoeflea sp.]